MLSLALELVHVAWLERPFSANEELKNMSLVRRGVGYDRRNSKWVVGTMTNHAMPQDVYGHAYICRPHE